MGIRVEGIDSVQRYIQREAERALRAFLDELDYLALEVVSAIRAGEASFWNDDTGNLRSSIGYIILYDGRVMHQNFEVVNGRGEQGKRNAKSFAQELASNYPSGIVLIIVAGMEYAAYVENIKSRTVLAGGKLLAKQKLKELNAKWNTRFGK